MSTIVLDAIAQLRRSVARAAATAFPEVGSGRQAAILRELRSSGPISQVSLARATASDPSFMVRLLDDLEERGLVRRSRSKADRREMAVGLTPKGRKALGPLDAALERLGEATEAGLTARERAVFVTLAGKIGRSLTSASQRGSRKSA
ncbi:MAG: MarR family transcriptional regulator [Archangium sp.]|nr:MarR family transcriptional regulator [Archangium sp.]